MLRVSRTLEHLVLLLTQLNVDVIRQANDTSMYWYLACKIIFSTRSIVYGLAAAIFSRDISQAIETAHKVQAGTVWVRSHIISSVTYV